MPTLRLALRLAACLLLAGTLAPARANVVLPTPVQSVLPEALSVSGHAEIKAKPDVAYVTLSVQTQAASSDLAVPRNAAQTTGLLAALRKAGVAPADIQTQGYQGQTTYDYQQSPPRPTGYEVVNTIQMTVHDLAQVGPLIDLSYKNGATQAGDVSFDLLHRKAVQNQALADAVRDARDRASILAQAAGVGVGRLLSLTDGAAPLALQSVYGLRATGMAASAPQVPTPIAPQQITITADVSAVYAIG